MARRKMPEPPKFEMSEFCANLVAEIRNASEPHRLYARDPNACDELTGKVADPVLAGAPIPLCTKLQYRWYVSEVVRLFRMRTGPELAMQLELVLVKWHGFGLRQDMMQWLLGAVWARVKSESAAG